MLTLLFAFIGFVLGWKLSKLKYRRYYAHKMARLFQEFNISRDDLRTAVQRIDKRQAADRFVNDDSVPIESLADHFTLIRLERVGNKVFAHHNDKFVGQAATVEEMRSLLHDKFDSIAFITEDDTISQELEESGVDRSASRYV